MVLIEPIEVVIVDNRRLTKLIDSLKVNVDEVLINGLANLTQQRLVRSPEAKLAVMRMRNKRIDIGFPHAEQMRRLSLFFGEPPTMLGMHDARFNGWNDFRLQKAEAELVFGTNLVALGNVASLRINLVHLKHRIRGDLAKERNLATF